MTAVDPGTAITSHEDAGERAKRLSSALYRDRQTLMRYIVCWKMKPFVAASGLALTPGTASRSCTAVAILVISLLPPVPKRSMFTAVVQGAQRQGMSEPMLDVSYHHELPLAYHTSMYYECNNQHYR